MLSPGDARLHRILIYLVISALACVLLAFAVDDDLVRWVLYVLVGAIVAAAWAIMGVLAFRAVRRGREERALRALKKAARRSEGLAPQRPPMNDPLP
jgi:bacteriorhodopsin